MRKPRATGALRLLVAAVAGLGLLAPPAWATSDPSWDKQWGPVVIGAPQAWATSTGAGVIIGVVDSGIDLNHEDLVGKVAAATACIGTSGDPSRCSASPAMAQDVVGHGTHVAGVAVATRDNGRGIAGVAPDARLAVARVFEGGSASLDDVNAGIRWVVDNGARVVNLSLGAGGGLLGSLLGGGGGSSLAPGIEYAWSRGAVTVLAAGNNNFLGLGSANYGTVNAVIVGATNRDDEPASYSSPTGNAKWAVAAPGGDVARGGTAGAIYSSFVRPGVPNDYAYLEGTSMAAPHVSGVLALLLARPGITNARAVEILLATANRSVRCGGTCVGRVDAAAAVAATGPAPAPPPPVPAPAPAAPSPRPAPRPAPTPPTLAPPVAVPIEVEPPPGTVAAPVDLPVEIEPVPDSAPPPDTDESALGTSGSADDSDGGDSDGGDSDGGDSDGGDNVAVAGAVAVAALLSAGFGTAVSGYRRRTTVTTLP